MVESETDPSEDEWGLDEKYGKQFDEEYYNDGLADWECVTVENNRRSGSPNYANIEAFRDNERFHLVEGNS